MSAAETLRGIRACEEAVAWASAHGGTLAELWLACPRGDWLLWYARKVRARREDLVRAAAGCAELALPYAGTGRGVCEAAIAAARAWADAPGAETANAAYVAANAADVAYAAMYATYAAADATYAAADATYAAAKAACAVADAAYAATYAAYAADAVAAAVADAAKGEMRRRCADVVREHIPFVAVAK